MAIQIGNIIFDSVRERIGKKGVYYQYDFYYDNENGTQQRKFCTFKNPLKLTGKDLAKALQADIDKNKNAAQLGVTEKAPKFKDMTEEYLKNVAEQEHALSSYHTEIKRAKRINSVLGEITVDKLNARIAQNYLVSLTANGANLRTGKGLASGTIKCHRTLIINVMDYAKRCGYITTNSIRYDTKLPKQKNKNQLDGKAKTADFNMFSEAEVIIFKELLDSDEVPIYWRCFFNILLATGARKSEILALEFGDFQDNRIHFDRSVVYVKGKGSVTNPDMKTSNSHRYNSVPDEVIDLVNQLKAYQKDRSRKLGDLWINSDNRLFVYWNGRQMHLNEPYSFLKNFIKKHSDKLHDVIVHSFRHLLVSSLVDSGFTVPQIAAFIGDTPATITSTYMHFFKRAEAERNSEAPANSLPIFNKNKEKYSQ